MPAPANTDEVIPDPADVTLDQKSEALMEGLFGDTPPPAKKKPAASEVEDDDEEEEEPSEEDEESEEDESEEEEEESSDDSEEDWDETPGKKTKKADSEEYEEPKNETEARKQAKLRGREAKKLRQDLQERDLELARVKEEVAAHKTRLEEIESVSVRPEEHPDFKRLRQEVLSDVKGASEIMGLPNPESLVKNFGPLLLEFSAMSDLDGEERDAARTKLHGSIVDKLKLSDIPYAEMEEDERRQVSGTIQDVLKVVQRNIPNHKELNKLHDSLTQRAKHGRLALGVREYESNSKEILPVLESVGDLADDIIEADPHSVASVVAKLVKTSPAAKKRLEKARAEVLEVLIGPRALTQKEIETIENNGTDIKDYLVERDKSFRLKRSKFAAYFLQGMMTRSALKEALVKLAKYEKEDDDDDTDLDLLKKTAKPAKAAAKKDKSGYVPVKDRPNPVDKLFGED